MLKFRNILVGLGLLCCAVSGAADQGGVAPMALSVAPVELLPGQDEVAVARHMEVLVDPEGHWSFSQVRGRFASRFVPNTADEPNFGFTSSVIWLRFTLDPSAVQGEDWYLVERYPILDSLTLFAPRADGGYRRVALGDTLPFHQRLMDHRAFIFPVDTELREPATYYVRVSGQGAINLSPMLYNSTGLVEYTYRDVLIYGVFYGCLLIMVVYNSLLALSLKEPVYLYFVLFLVGILVFNLNINGFGLQFAWPDLPRLNEYYWLGIYICLPALAMYSRHFLALRQRFPRYDRLLRHFLVAVLVALAVQLALPVPWSYYLSTLMVMITVLLFSWLGWAVWSRGYRAARLYVAAWFVFLALILVFVFGYLDWLPYASVVTMLPHIATLWVVVMLSLALGDRIRFLERERNQLSLEARSNLENHLAEIEHMNREKSTFLQYLSHELNTPINWIGAADALGDGDERDRESRELVRKGQERLTGLVSTSLRYFDLADRQSAPLITLCRPSAMVDSLITDLGERTTAEGMRVLNRVPGELRVHASEGELREVLAMGLDNALRYGAGGAVDIDGEQRAAEVELRIHDRGRGANPVQLNELFEPFFVMGSRHHEEGYGLSLAIARLMIEQAGGRIWAESQGPERGFTLVLRLPAA